MSDPTTRNDELSIIEAEHRRLRNALKRLADAEDADSARAQLVQLIPLLSDHFAREEAKGGLYAIIRERSPHSAHALEALLKEHAEFREQARQLARDLERGDWGSTRPKTRELVRSMQRHESRENQLLNDSVLLDLGSGD